jgi:hypothetical protein
MFVGDEVRLDAGFAVARERLLRIGEGDALLATSAGAYGPGLTRVGVAGASKLVWVHARVLSWTNISAVLALRWEATGPDGGLFPVLDADLTLTPAGVGAMLTLAGAYRPPLGPLDQAPDRAILNRVAATTIRNFLLEVAAQLDDHPVPNGAGSPEWKA